jgi:sigma-B regulation protein RsbU (phosphoserine phosphatase)
MPSEMVFLLVDEILSSRILIISADAEFAENLDELLRTEGFDSITIVKDIAEAIFFLKPFLNEDPSPVDLIIFEGGDLCEEKIEEVWNAKETFEMLDIPLVVTGEPKYSEEIVELIETGCIDFIQKPLTSINLVSRLKTLLNLRLANRKLKKHQFELQNLTSQLEHKNRRLSSILEDIRFDLQLAGELQRSFLPPERIGNEDVEFAYFYQPCETIGGDLINVVPVSSRYFVIYLLDVSGHGVSAALLAFAIHRYLSSESSRSLIKKAGGEVREPAEVLKMLNKDFLMHNEWFKYFTITYAVYDSKTRLLRYCRAGQTPLLIIKNRQEPQLLMSGSPPVGVSSAATFKEEKILLETGDRLYLYSDGFTEAKGPKDEIFGEDRLMQGLKCSECKSLKAQIEKFTQHFFDWLGSERPRDDIALLAMKIK